MTPIRPTPKAWRARLNPCPVLDVLRLCSFSLSRAISRLFTVLGVATPPLGYAPLPKNYFQEELRDARKRGVSVNTLSAELKAAGITISSGALAKYLSRRSSNSATKRSTTAAKPNHDHVPEPHGQVKTGTKEPEHRESGTGPK